MSARDFSGRCRGCFRTRARGAEHDPHALARPRRREPMQSAAAATRRPSEIDPPRPDGLRISYAPDSDGDPDAGEIVWTWVPYAENDGRGKDRPVLVIGRQDADRVFAVRLTSKSHDGERDFLSIGTGPWDSQGRPSWVDVDQLYSVHSDGHAARGIRAGSRAIRTGGGRACIVDTAGPSRTDAASSWWAIPDSN